MNFVLFLRLAMRKTLSTIRMKETVMNEIRQQLPPKLYQWHRLPDPQWMDAEIFLVLFANKEISKHFVTIK